MVWQPGSRHVITTAHARTRGSFAVMIVPKSEPKLRPVMPIFCESISGRVHSQSTTAGPAAIQFSMLTWMPYSGDSFWPGPSIASTAKPRESQRSPLRDTAISLNPSMPGTSTTTGTLPVV